MQIRCTVQMDQVSRKLVLVGQDSETAEHLALKLAGFVLFFNENPTVAMSLKSPALAGQEFKPDLLCLNEHGETGIWIECGNVATYKLDKLLRRNRNARIVVLKGTLNEANNLRRALGKNDIKNAQNLEILSFPDGQFDSWLAAMDESMEIFGESAPNSFNLVANATPFSFEFVKV